MTETNKQILDLINKNASVNEISKITGLTNKQLFHRLNLLKNQGYDFKRKYYYNGDITYQLVKSIRDDNKNNNEATVLTSKKGKEFKALLISDLHIGNVKERVDFLDKSYNYCAKEGINIIINGGDLIDGTLCGSGKKKINNIEKQIEYLLKVYPFDKNILNFVCLGNHDYNSITSTGQDLLKVLNNKRHDIISLGYGTGKLNIKNDCIYIKHNIENLPKLSSLNHSLILSGHSHEMKYVQGANNLVVSIPSLSNIKNGIPGAIKMTLSFNNGFFNVGIFEHLIYSDNIYKVSESQYLLSVGKDTSIDFKKNIEERTPIKTEEKVKTLTLENTKSQRLTQIEKFNRRMENSK